MPSSKTAPSRNRFGKIALVLAGAGLGAVLSLSFTAVADKESSNPLPVDELRAFSTVFGLIKQSYVEPVEDKKLINEAIKGMVSGLDPHSSYLDADAFKDLQESTQGEFGGLGLEVNMEDGLVRVVSPIEDTPAFRAGIKAGDFIVKIDDTQVQGLALNEAVGKMRGKPGTAVTLTVLRKGESKPLIFTLKRAVIKVQSVKYKLTEPGIGYVRITQFQERTTQMLADALNSLYKENKAPLKGLVLDLRNDPGGLLNGAVGVSAAFLPKDALVVYTDGRTPDSKMKLFARKEDYARGGKDELAGLPRELKSVPLVVLINSGSASASEIVAGALQDHKRALVVGTQSFGKGSVQTILPIDSKSALKLTTAKYFTPAGRSIQAKGIVPDIEVQEATLTGKDDEASPWRLREADLERHLDNPNDNGEGKKPATKPSPLPTPAKPKATAPKASESAEDEVPSRELASKSDYQLQQAISVLKVQQLLMQKAASAPAAAK
ncbi:S41 family peptidase [Chitinilyticum litopenaei]|uniref:S41 family peptidase n=1 Tax=Chitinilyticum litopenaei TaxID=1121276 RepID=UPI0004025612|nr:S41 family peptidase [Chitinilyticum litopenaei]